MNLREFITLVALAARGQQTTMPVIGYRSAARWIGRTLRGPFLKALEDAGFFVRRNVASNTALIGRVEMWRGGCR